MTEDRAPFLTLVVPAFDRDATIGRCLRSVLAQDINDWELICVDDGSTDGTAEAVRAIPDPRIRLVAHAANRGVGPARNTGIAAARGAWIVFLDSDDELAGPDALRRMTAYAADAPPELHALWFRSRLDDGSLSPADPLPVLCELDYEGFLRFTEDTHGRSRDMIRCVRRTCFDLVRYPETRMLEEGFHLDFARLFRSRLHPDVLRLYHADAPNSLVRLVASPASRRDAGLARDRADGLRALVRTHGTDLARLAPCSLRAWGFRGIRLALRAGDGRGARATARALCDAFPTDPAMLFAAFVTIAFSLVAPRRLAAAPLLLLAPLLAACGTVETAAMAPAPAVPDAAATLPAPPPYRIQAGDVLDIRLPTSPDLDDEVTVRPDGHLSTTVVGDAPAAGLTVPALEQALGDAYAATLRHPALSVIVKSASPMRVYVAGEVAHPGEFRADGAALTLAEAVTLAGGPKLAGDTRRVFILRRGPDGTARFLRTRYDRIQDGDAPEADVLLAPYDVVFVPRTGIALGYEYFNQYVQQFVPVSWGFSYVLNESHATVTQPTATVP